MDAAPHLVDGASSRDQRLASDLPTKYTLTIFVGAAAPKDIDFNLLNVKQRHEVVKRLLGRCHPSMLAEVCSVAFALTNMLDSALRTIALTTKGFMPEAEGDALFVAARSACEALPGLPMVEVGSYCGRSTVWLGAVARERGTVLHAVDHHGGSEENQAGWEWHDP